ncbi:hypothetical protein CEXT_596061 [Caerostris extrusa]|uniref:Uncharacterized protein n=1 Tax=Caerostris extrusa TaxID=172846 RepID=A0AAV4WQT5_CAEEX|nr:hypothetical protein CEXT_596061 [Caerostris extrusa]
MYSINQYSSVMYSINIIITNILKNSTTIRAECYISNYSISITAKLNRALLTTGRRIYSQLSSPRDLRPPIHSQWTTSSNGRPLCSRRRSHIFSRVVNHGIQIRHGASVSVLKEKKKHTQKKRNTQTSVLPSAWNNGSHGRDQDYEIEKVTGE